MRLAFAISVKMTDDSFILPMLGPRFPAFLYGQVGVHRILASCCPQSRAEWGLPPGWMRRRGVQHASRIVARFISVGVRHACMPHATIRAIQALIPLMARSQKAKSFPRQLCGAIQSPIIQHKSVVFLF